MSGHKLTPTEEMYLIAISILNSDNPNKLVSISTMAGELKVQPVSANQMINKLVEEGWVNYLPYQGVDLTDRGADQAYRVLWIRRLWETFLLKDLGISQENFKEIACDLEHHTSMEVAEALDKFLGYPEFPFQGNRILRGPGERSRAVETFLLKEMAIDSTAVVVEISSDLITQNFLSNEGVKPGVRISTKAIGSCNDYLIECEGRRILISKEIASEIILRDEFKIK